MSHPPPYSDFDSGSMSSTTNDDRSHPGKFNDLDGFLRAQRTYSGPPNYNGYREVHFVNPEPGAIIHVIDRLQSQNSPVNQRVMLVIRHEDPSTMTSRAMTCIPLCIYEGGFPNTSGRYWSVQQEAGMTAGAKYGHRVQHPGRATPSSQKMLSVSLDRNLYLEDGITANLGELWRVDYDHILVDKIGQVPNGSLAPALSKISELFAASLKTRQHKLAETTRPVESQKTRVFTVGNSWDGHYVRKRQH